MSDILVRGVDESTVAEIDRRAAEQGLSRAEYLRRQLDAVYRMPESSTVTIADWQRFHDATTDLDDPGLMGQAWS